MRARAIERVRRVEDPELEQLARIIPLVDRLPDVEAFIALKTDQIGLERRGSRRCECRLADTGLTLEKKRAIETERQKQRDGKAPIGDVMVFGEPLLQSVY